MNWCFRGTQALLLGAVVYAPLAFGATRSNEFAVVEWLAAGAIFLWGGRLLLEKEARFYWPPVAWAVALILAYAVARYLAADVEYIARQECLRIGVYALFFLALINHLPRPESGRVLLMVLLGLAAAVAAYAIVQFLTGSNLVWGVNRPATYANRGSGTYISPNHLAGFLEMLLPAGLIYALGERLPRSGRLGAGLASLIMFAGLIGSGSRGGWLATAYSLALLFGWMALSRLFRTKAALWVLALTWLSVLLLFSGNWSANRRGAFRDMTQLVDIRFNLWLQAAQMWRDHVWWGVGPNHFDVRYPQYRPPDNTMQRHPEWVHNDYLNVLVDWGVAGAALAALAAALWIGRAAREWPAIRAGWLAGKFPHSEVAPARLSALFGLSALWAHSLVEFNLHIPANAMVAASLMAIVAAPMGAAPSPKIRARWASRVTGGVLIGVAGLLGWQAARLSVESHWLSEARSPSKFSLTQADALKKAHAVEPMRARTAYDIGECYRLSSWRGQSDYREMAQRALPWFEEAMGLNRWDPLSRLRHGMCLDWLGRHEEAEPFFLEALALDRNGYYTVAHVGWHYVQIGDFLTARKWFRRSMQIFWEENPIARQYLEIIGQELK